MCESELDRYMDHGNTWCYWCGLGKYLAVK